MVEIIVTDLVPLRIRGQYYSFISSMWAVGSVAGPILGTHPIPNPYSPSSSPF